MENMEIVKTKIEDVYIINNINFCDERGSFIKVFNEDLFRKYNLCCDYKESYYSISNKNVIRGMHFQKEPFEHEKLVSIINGRIIDVVVDLRKSSKTFKDFIFIELDCKKSQSIYIPKGCAHGFLSLEDNTVLLYNVSSVYNNEYDTGIRFDSFGMKWGVKEPILSKRDLEFCGIDELQYYF